MSILYIIITLLILIVLHELGHFLLAKKYDVRVDEFGVGIPPRLWGKKIGETIYSLNWIPLGGFVRLYGEDKRINEERSFSSKPLYQKALIVFGGIAAFFVIAFFVFSVYSVVGVRAAVDEDTTPPSEINDPQVVVTHIIEGSSAAEAGVEKGDIIINAEGERVESAKEITSLTEERRGKETEIVVDRKGEKETLLLTPSEDSEEVPAGMGVVLTAKEQSPFYLAPLKGAEITGRTTVAVVSGFATLIHSGITGTSLPEGMEVGGPVAIVDIGAGAFDRGLPEFLNFVGVITISLAVVNSLPVPALDGGRLLFLGIEKMKGSPISERIEQATMTFSFIMLLALMAFITFKDLGSLGVL